LPVEVTDAETQCQVNIVVWSGSLSNTVKDKVHPTTGHDGPGGG